MPDAGDFYKASDARDQTVIRAPIMAEISMLQGYVSSAIEAGILGVVVGPGLDPAPPGFTASTDAFFAWWDTANHQESSDRVLRYQMDSVFAYFTKLGYNVTRHRYMAEDKFSWELKW